MQSFRWLVVGCALLGCGEPKAQTCDLYECVNSIRLHGERTLARDVTLVDVRSCREDDCMSSLLAVSSETHCDPGPRDRSVCVDRDGDVLRVDVKWWNEGWELPREAGPYRVEVTDHANADVLLDETRTLTPKVTRKDECHVCWAGEAEL